MDDGNTARIGAAFAGILVTTIVGALWIAVGGIAENPPASRWPYPLDVPFAAAVVEGIWILLTCGTGRRAVTPTVTGAISVSVLLAFAHAS